jgi:hypothetical protein
MKIRLFILASLALALVSHLAAAGDLADLKLLYIGDRRADEYVAFLKPNVAMINVETREAFKPADAAPYDVVLLDWPQEGMNDFPPKTSPLGARESWGKPTVLLGSAGLKLAVVWKLKGGSGCTCLDPLAYGWRDHPIFQQPFQIDCTKTARVPTPPDFRDEIKEAEIDILPLVHDIHRQWQPGWTTYAKDFSRFPDIEYFIGGVNHKTPTAAAVWRHGNLLHFGFEQSPLEMNEMGQKLLLNSIAYISHFAEDRPIAVTPSPFAGEVAPPRDRSNLPPEQREFLHPDENQKLVVDEDLKALGVAFDKPAFFDKMIAGLEGDAPESERAARLLQRYVSCGPRNANADQWSSWWQANRVYMFASDSGDYRWYIDPLAKKRGVPTTDLRGIKRADSRFLTTAAR